MHDILTRLHALKRPRLMQQATRHGKKKYRQDKDLKRILAREELPSRAETVAQLLDREFMFEHDRKLHCPRYSYGAHIEVLIALMCEGEQYLTENHVEMGRPRKERQPTTLKHSQRQMALT